MELYESIEHLVQTIHIEPTYVDIEFLSDCGNFRQVVTVARQPTSPPPAFESRSLKHWFRAIVRKVLGQTTGALSPEEKRRLVEVGFESVKPRLVKLDNRWSRGTEQEHPTERFDRQLRTNPIVETYDIEVLVRVLLEVSRSDSDLRTEERAFLSEIVSDESTIKRLAQVPKITVCELAETSSVPVKETILMLAWAMAYADGQLDPPEMRRLNQLCRGFMLPELRVRALQLAAKLFLLDRYFQSLKQEGKNRPIKVEVERKAQEWGLDEQHLKTLRGWYPQDLGNQP